MNFSPGKIIAFADGSITRKLYLHTAIVAIFLLLVISITIWASNTLTMITAIARFERTHTVSRVEAMVALLKYLDIKKPEDMKTFQAKMAITQSYNKVFSQLLDMRKDTPDVEFVRILETTFSETDHKTAEIIVNRIKVLYWHPILKVLVANAAAANLEGEKIKVQAAQFIAASNEAERAAILSNIDKIGKEFTSLEIGFSKSCSDLSNQISLYVNFITIALLFISVGFTGLLTYMIARTVVQQAKKYTSELEKEIQVRKLTEQTLIENNLLLKSVQAKLQYKNEELQVNDEELRSQNDQLQSTEEMLRVQINEYEASQTLLQESRKLYRNFVEGTQDLITRVDTEGRLEFLNRTALKIYGLPPDECIGRMAFDFIHPDDRESTIAAFNAWIQSNEDIFTHENRQIGISGSGHHHMAWTIRADRDENGTVIGFASTARDITDSKHNQEDKDKLEAQLLQAQKMESVGRLAGGVAHDFNNMLTVILGHTQLALMKSELPDPLRKNLEEIRSAAERSADLTKQLLAFARKQTIAPKVLDLNETVSGMLKMLQRLIGEDINLNWHPAPNLWNVELDPSQIDQILANLCVNARDSIKDGGKITIETGSIVLDEEYCAQNTGFEVGEYVRLTVSDNGCGMDKTTQAQIFEPFFTTKGLGEGTGLGLATVYGIVKQNKGFINLYSEPGLGTTFTIYLPRYVGKAEQAKTIETIEPSRRGCETILLVEDEHSILNITTMILTNQGYTVIAANSPGEAIHLASERAGGIDLLMTDVVMPEMNGRDLAKKLQSLNPELKCLYMSGYTANIIAHHGVLDAGLHFIQKPFNLNVLTDKLREVLDS